MTAPMLKHDKGVNAIDLVSDEEDTDSNFDNWIFPTTDNGIYNWKTKYVISISFRQE